jgi:hypothetical protein
MSTHDRTRPYMTGDGSTQSADGYYCILGEISGCVDAGDFTTLANPEVVDEIRRLHGPCELAKAA